MRFLIRVDPNLHVTITTPQGVELAERQLAARPYEKFNYPIPPKPPDAAAPHYELCKGDKPELIAEIKRNIDNRRIRENEIDAFARYLFDTLIGESAWMAIMNAQPPNDPLIELALTWAADDVHLHRLNWEMMKRAEGFLAAGIGKRGVAITRIVPRDDLDAPQLDTPPRVLFVIGAELTDPKIRPAAELLGLLRQIKSGGRAIHWRALENASPKRLEAMMNAFQPQVVHFICHGRHDNQGRALLELRSDETNAPAERPAAQLLQYLNVNGKPPPIVVLSACYTATSGETRLMNAGQTAPLAAELIAGDVPVVIGMAGRVSDIACRLFTQRFGDALVAGKSLVTATEVARRATFAYGANPRQSIDWALPAVFMASKVDAAYKPVPTENQDTSDLIETWISKYKVEEPPIFCGRDEFFQMFYELFDPDPQKIAPKRAHVLAAYAEAPTPGIGRKRLLKELTIQTLRDGHIPLLVMPPEPNPPTTLLTFANLLREKCEGAGDILFGDGRFRAHQLFGLSKPLQTALANPHLDERIKQELQDHGLTRRALRWALRMDFANLAKQAREKHAAVQRAHGRVVVLLDAIDRWGEVTSALLDDESILDTYGLGTEQEPIPVVLTLSLKNAQSNLTSDLVDKLSKRWWFKTLPLKPFETNGQDMMAYALVLLHPFDQFKYQDISDHAWAVNDEVDAAIREKWEARFRKRLKGLPKELGSDAFYQLAEDSKDDKFVIEADDRNYLEPLLRQE